jgi:hypothetical protein
VLTRRATHGIPLGHIEAAEKQAGRRAADTLKHATCFPKIDTDFGPMRKGRNAWQGFSLYPEPLIV